MNSKRLVVVLKRRPALAVSSKVMMLPEPIRIAGPPLLCFRFELSLQRAEAGGWTVGALARRWNSRSSARCRA
jgi:hypothetical protein